MRPWCLVLAMILAAGTLVQSGGAAPDGAAPRPDGTPQSLALGVWTSRLGAVARARAEAVLEGAVFAHRVTGLRCPSREVVFRFLLDHPDFAASVARALRVGDYSLTPREDGYWGDDNRGAQGMLRVLYADDERRLYHLEGRYDRRLMPTIEGQLLILLEFRHAEDEESGSVLESSLTGHIRVDTPVVGGLAQALGALARPVIEREVERKVRRFFNTVARVSRWARDEPEQLVAALEGNPAVPQDGTLAAFRAMVLADRPPSWAGTRFRLLPTPLLLLDPDPSEP